MLYMCVYNNNLCIYHVIIVELTLISHRNLPLPNPSQLHISSAIAVVIMYNHIVLSLHKIIIFSVSKLIQAKFHVRHCRRVWICIPLSYVYAVILVYYMKLLVVFNDRNDILDFMSLLIRFEVKCPTFTSSTLFTKLYSTTTTSGFRCILFLSVVWIFNKRVLWGKTEEQHFIILLQTP